MQHTLQPVRRSKFAVPASLEHCEDLGNVLLERKQLTLPPRTRADIQRLFHWTYPVTLPAAGIRADALAFLLWETSWRGMSTVKQGFRRSESAHHQWCGPLFGSIGLAYSLNYSSLLVVRRRAAPGGSPPQVRFGPAPPSPTGSRTAGHEGRLPSPSPHTT